jgi:hypothetical protein
VYSTLRRISQAKRQIRPPILRSILCYNTVCCWYQVTLEVNVYVICYVEAHNVGFGVIVPGITILIYTIMAFLSDVHKNLLRQSLQVLKYSKHSSRCKPWFCCFSSKKGCRVNNFRLRAYTSYTVLMARIWVLVVE